MCMEITGLLVVSETGINVDVNDKHLHMLPPDPTWCSPGSRVKSSEYPKQSSHRPLSLRL